MKFLCYNNQAVIEPAVRHGPGTSYGGVAQLGERTVRIRKVKGSNPSVSTKKDCCLDKDSNPFFLETIENTRVITN